jgi:hypothetical protein
MGVLEQFGGVFLNMRDAEKRKTWDDGQINEGRKQQQGNGRSKSQLPFYNGLQIENKLLYLIQLWSDTFAMHENEFKCIIEAYRTLRYEGKPSKTWADGLVKTGVKFPERNFKDKFMIKFEGTKSPILEVLENNYQPEASSKSSSQSKKANGSGQKPTKKYPTKARAGPGPKDEIVITPELIKMLSKEEVNGLLGFLSRLCGTNRKPRARKAFKFWTIS